MWSWCTEIHAICQTSPNIAEILLQNTEAHRSCRRKADYASLLLHDVLWLPVRTHIYFAKSCYRVVLGLFSNLSESVFHTSLKVSLLGPRCFSLYSIYQTGNLHPLLFLLLRPSVDWPARLSTQQGHYMSSDLLHHAACVPTALVSCQANRVHLVWGNELYKFFFFKYTANFDVILGGGVSKSVNEQELSGGWHHDLYYLPWPDGSVWYSPSNRCPLMWATRAWKEIIWCIIFLNSKPPHAPSSPLQKMCCLPQQLREGTSRRHQVHKYRCFTVYLHWHHVNEMNLTQHSSRSNVESCHQHFRQKSGDTR